MPRIRQGKKRKVQTWEQTIANRIKDGKAVPIISSQINHNLVLGGFEKSSQNYVEYRSYPIDERHPIPRVAQYYSIIDEAITDARSLKDDYVNFIKNKLFDIAENDGVPRGTLAEVEEEFDNIDLSEFSERLGYPRFDRAEVEPLVRLADLPLPIYLTTDYHDFIEVALRRAGKNPRTEICRWHKGLDSIPSVFDGKYQPTKDEPLVYHLLGYDAYPESMVLTEDEHLEFLIAIRQNLGRDTDPISLRVRQAMAESSVILLGYSLRDLDFKVVFWGLIKPRPIPQTSVSVQLPPSDVERAFLEKYLNTFEFRVYWGDIQKYTNELSEALES
ncbi:MAG: SIR2 family protein [Anaerolineae bacterium]|nr:SIR2 family protein [Anaerolineae bacterium]